MISNEYKSELARQIFPGHTFFGFEEPMQLNISIEDRVDCLNIGIESHGKEFLNLGGITLLSASGAILDLSETLSSARLSTTYNDQSPQDVLDLLIKRKRIHSGHERLPCLTLELKKPTHLQCIKVANRPGRWGCRSRDLTLRAWIGNRLIIDYRNNCVANLRQRFATLIEQFVALPPDDAKSEHPEIFRDIEKVALETRGRIIDELVTGRLDLPASDLYSLIPVYKTSNSTDDRTKKLLGEVVARLVEKGNGMSTAKLRDFQTLMASPTEIETIRNYATESLNRRSGKQREIIFSKHRIAIGGSSLTKRGDEYLSALQCVQRQLEEWTITSMICYGTLLGAIRDGNFIAHDDDVDMLMIDNSTTRECMIRNADDLITRFQSEGFKAQRAGMNFHVTPPNHNVTVDIFPSWHDNDGYWVMMERGKYRNVPNDCLLPVKTVELQGQQFVCPNNPAAFLADRYGPDWQIADPYHEWPWPLAEPAKVSDNYVNNTSKKNIGRTCLVAWGQRVRDTHNPPKNSLPVISIAKELGYDAIKLDIRISNDGIAILSNKDILTSTNGEIQISKSVAEELYAFKLGSFESEDVYIPSLESALKLAKPLDVQIDCTVDSNGVAALRAAVDAASFNPINIQFCIYNADMAASLAEVFPESVLLWKVKSKDTKINVDVIEKIEMLGLDGIMVPFPRQDHTIHSLMEIVKSCNLRVLVYTHGKVETFPGGRDESLLSICESRVDYVTTFAGASNTFQNIVKNSDHSVENSLTP